MRLRCKKFKHAMANCLVIPLGAGKAIKFNDIGQVSDDLEDELCYKLMAEYGPELDLIKDDAELAKYETKAVAAPKTKAG